MIKDRSRLTTESATRSATSTVSHAVDGRSSTPRPRCRAWAGSREIAGGRDPLRRLRRGAGCFTGAAQRATVCWTPASALRDTFGVRGRSCRASSRRARRWCGHRRPRTIPTRGREMDGAAVGEKDVVSESPRRLTLFLFAARSPDADRGAVTASSPARRRPENPSARTSSSTRSSGRRSSPAEPA